MSHPLDSWLAEACKAVVESVAGTHTHLMRSCLVEAYNRGVSAARASLGTLLVAENDVKTLEAAVKAIDALKVSEGM